MATNLERFTAWAEDNDGFVEVTQPSDEGGGGYTVVELTLPVTHDSAVITVTVNED